MKPIILSRKTAEILLAAIIIARSTSFLFSKILLQSMGPLTLLAVRFLIAFLLLLLLFHKKLAGIRLHTLLGGMLLGGIYFSLMVAELSSLQTTPSSTVCFLENTAIVFVPLLNSILHRKFPRVPLLLRIGVTMLGIGFLTAHGGSLSFSTEKREYLALLAALLYATAIILTDRLSRKEDAFTLGILQVGFLGCFALIAAFLLETPRMPVGLAEWGPILALAFICSSFGYTLQPVAQRYTSAERVSMFCALSPVSSAILGRIFLSEILGITGTIGAALVIGSILVYALEKQSPITELPNENQDKSKESAQQKTAIS